MEQIFDRREFILGFVVASFGTLAVSSRFAGRTQ
jgi:hypothetical protein